MAGLNVLFVCTGNICRSPAAELLATRAFDDAGIRFSSAGTQGLAGAPIAATMAELLEADGVGTLGFAARRLTPQTLTGIDLVLGMTRAHRAAAAQMSPALVRSAFTLTEFAQVCQAAAATEPMRQVGAVERLVGLLEEAPRYRTATAAASEIDDPYGRDRHAYETALRQITDAIDALADLVLNRVNRYRL